MRPEDLSELGRVDLDGPGPARPLSDRRARRMVGAALSAASMGRPRRAARTAAMVGVCIAAAGAAAAAGWQYTRAHRSMAGAPSGRELPTAAQPVVIPLPATAPPPAAPPALPPPAAPSAVHERGPAHDLLRAANQKRRQRRWAEADALYRRVVREFPGTAPAYVALVAQASLHLEHLHDARGALGLYRTALRKHPDGALREEADYGVAEAYRALGRPAAERRALGGFLREHPDSAMAPRATRRLDELGGQAP